MGRKRTRTNLMFEESPFFWGASEPVGELETKPRLFSHPLTEGLCPTTLVAQTRCSCVFTSRLPLPFHVIAEYAVPYSTPFAKLKKKHRKGEAW